MQRILIKEDLFDVIEDESPENSNDKYLKRDRKARALINLCIEDPQIIHVNYETKPKEIWNKLKLFTKERNEKYLTYHQTLVFKLWSSNKFI